MRITTHIDEEFRERADDPEHLERARTRLVEDLHTLRDTLDEQWEKLEVTRLGRVLNRLSEYAKLAGDWREGLQYGREALEIWERLERDKAVFLARLRCAEIQYFLGTKRLEALETMDELLEICNTSTFEMYRDVALEVRGRCRCANGRHEAGRDDLECALEIRRDRGNERLVHRTRELLERIDRST